VSGFSAATRDSAVKANVENLPLYGATVPLTRQVCPRARPVGGRRLAVSRPRNTWSEGHSDTRARHFCRARENHDSSPKKRRDGGGRAVWQMPPAPAPEPVAAAWRGFCCDSPGRAIIALFSGIDRTKSAHVCSLLAAGRKLHGT